MFSVVKVRDGIAADDYNDPGPYRHPEGTVAYEYTGPVAEAPVAHAGRASQTSAARGPAADLRVVKPGAKSAQRSSH
jgi:L-ascorbate oxidase